MADVTVELALEQAHLPALLAAMVHVTGDESWVRPEWKPTYNMFERSDIGLSAELQAGIRAQVAEALRARAPGAPPKLSRLPVPLLRRMMDFVGGQEIPEAYVDFLMDELALAGTSTKDPQFEQLKIKDAARKLKVLVIGAGMSGLLTGIRLTQAGVPFEIIEKNPDVGGTWFENTYPGCRVDNANHMYSYSFEPNHGWPQHFSTQPVLLEYFRGVAQRYGLREKIHFETKVETLTWDERQGLWRVVLKGKDGRTETLEASAVVSAVGQLNQPRYPDLEGLGTFEGPAFHSAEWRHDVALDGKRVAVIGTGASAFQFVPEIAPKVASLKVFMRTPPWGMPAAHYHEDVHAGKKWLLEQVPFYDKWYRFWLFWITTEGVLPMLKSDPAWPETTAVSAENAMLRDLVAQHLASQLEDRPDLKDKVIPRYPIGGKRAVLDNGVWLGALKRPNVELITDKIRKITPKGLMTEDGAEHEADVLIYGTGFHASKFLRTLQVKGRGGRDLHEAWGGDARAYLGMTVPDFPNFFILYGPNTNIVVNGSIIFFSECSVRYVVGCLKLLAESGARALEPKREVFEQFNARVDEANQQWAWASPHVNSWYKNEFGRISQNWPFGLIDYWRATLSPNPEDFRLEHAPEPVA